MKKRIQSSWNPHSVRYCVVCMKATRFEYNKLSGHSECTYCGGRFPKHPKNITFEDQYELVIVQKNKKIQELKKEIIALKQVDAQRRKEIGGMAKTINSLMEKLKQ